MVRANALLTTNSKRIDPGYLSRLTTKSGAFFAAVFVQIVESGHSPIQNTMTQSDNCLASSPLYAGLLTNNRFLASRLTSAGDRVVQVTSNLAPCHVDEGEAG